MTPSRSSARSRWGAATRAGALTCLSAAALATLASPAGAAEVFNGRIAFASVRADPQQRDFDLFSVTPDGAGPRRLTTNPEADRQPDWSPGGTAIAYSIRKPASPINFEVARMTAGGRAHRRLTTTPDPQASSQPAWLPNGRGILFRRSGPSRVASIWQMGARGQHPALRLQPPHPVLYPSWSPDGQRVLYTAILSPAGDSDRGIFTLAKSGGEPTVLFDVEGAYDSAPAWSPDGERIAFESDADIDGANPERDMEIWVMDADGGRPRQLTRNGAHDEGPAWSPDGRLLAYTSGPDDSHGDIHVMTDRGRHVRRLTDHPGADESPDWQSIPAPRSDRRCGDVARRDARDVRAAGGGGLLSCLRARLLAGRWVRSGRPRRIDGYVASVKHFGGTRRVLLRRGDGDRRRLVAFLHEPSS